MVDPVTAPSPAAPTGDGVTAPAAVNDNASRQPEDTLSLRSAMGMVFSPRPPHTQNGNTLAPTAEFTRIFLLAWIIRYIFRGTAKLAFNKEVEGFGSTILNALSKPGRALQLKHFPRTDLEGMEAAAYSLMVGAGSGYLSFSYSQQVKSDIQNLFRETVAYEKNIPQEQITFNDIRKSKNNIVSLTVHNYHKKTWERLGTDALFFLAAPLRSIGVTDLLLGGKGLQIFLDTWKRKTTMFEDLITFINNKINPRNGLGQPITVGEVFDLYQHYAEKFHPGKMFANVLESGGIEDRRWLTNQPIFQRMTELMNQTYAYKHATVLGPDGHAVRQAAFTLPKLMYLMGHDLIDVDAPEKTLAAIELANRYGIPAVKDMQAMLAGGASLAAVQTRYPYPARAANDNTVNDNEKNGVIAKGSTLQLDGAPGLKIDAASIHHQQALQPQSAALQANLP